MSARHLENYYRQFQLAIQLPIQMAASLGQLSVVLLAMFADICRFGAHCGLVGAILRLSWALLGHKMAQHGPRQPELGLDRSHQRKPVEKNCREISKKLGQSCTLLANNCNKITETVHYRTFQLAVSLQMGSYRRLSDLLRRWRADYYYCYCNRFAK